MHLRKLGRNEIRRQTYCETLKPTPNRGPRRGFDLGGYLRSFWRFTLPFSFTAEAVELENVDPCLMHVQCF